ncbi:MAG: arginine repressor [Clostridia bacterium]|nr:arginine repressor [Clostridia bacterium]
MMKQRRHSRILKVIKENDIKTQEELTSFLKNDGFEVTQATVSRDIKELGLVKVPSARGGYKYAFANRVKTESSQHLNIFSKAVTSINYAMHTVVVKTYGGMAPAVAASLDAVIGNEILGTIA